MADQKLIALALQPHSKKQLKELSRPLNDLLDASSFQKLPTPLKTGKPFQDRKGYREWIKSLPKESRPERYDDLFGEARKHSKAWSDFLHEEKSLSELDQSLPPRKCPAKSNIQKAQDTARRIRLKLEDIVAALFWIDRALTKKILLTLGGREGEFIEALHLGVKLGLLKPERKNRFFHYSLVPYEELKQEGKTFVSLSLLCDMYRPVINHSKQASGLRAYYPEKRKKKRSRLRRKSVLEDLETITTSRKTEL